MLFDSNGKGQVVSIHPETGAGKIVKEADASRSMSGGLAFVGGELLAGRIDASGEVYRIDPVTGDVLGSLILDGSGTLTGLAGDGLVGSTLLPGEIRGRHWNDLDGNGSWDAGEPPLAGWTLFHDANQNGRARAGEIPRSPDQAAVCVHGSCPERIPWPSSPAELDADLPSEVPSPDGCTRSG